MFKKLVSGLSLLLMVATFVPSSAFAEESSFTLTSLTISENNDNGAFDPSPSGDNETLTISYALSSAADNVKIDISNSDDTFVYTQTASSNARQNGSFTWNGIFETRLVTPGVYTLSFQATKSGATTISETRTFNVRYDSTNKSLVSNLRSSQSTFDPAFSDVEITFENSQGANLTVEVLDRNGYVIRGFDSYKNTVHQGGAAHKILWDGTNNSGNNASNGDYTVRVVARNDYGVSMGNVSVKVDRNLTNLPESNDHISKIKFRPASTFEPGDDEEMTIEFTVREDLDSLEVVAVRGNEEFEIEEFDELNRNEEIEISWDGTEENDGEDYVSEGTWRIEFRSKKGSTTAVAAKVIKIKYDQPKINDFFLSKKEIDPDLGEFTSIIFRVDSDAVVDLVILEDGDEDDMIEEDFEVEKNVWYAVDWDGGSYDYGDDIKIQIVAKNVVNDKIQSTASVPLKFAEVKSSSRKANVINDYISPVVMAVNGKEDFILNYELDNDAVVTITIHKGQNGTGSSVAELVTRQQQDEGSQEVVWNGEKDGGGKLAKGIYSYKIVSRLNSTDTAVGVFVIGDVGSTSDNSSSGGNNNSGKVNPNVNVNGGNSNSNNAFCAGFNDVRVDSPQCEAIKWAKNRGIIEGYSDGTFRPYAAINRVETLKVIFHTAGTTTNSYFGGNLGFHDVTENSWYMPYIATGLNLGVFSGDGNAKTARPNDTVKRAELLKLVFETSRVGGKDSINNCFGNYTDVVGNVWYGQYACKGNSYQLFGTSFLNPGMLSTRGEVIEVLYKLSSMNKL